MTPKAQSVSLLKKRDWHGGHICTSSTQKTEERQSQVQDQPGIHSEFKVSLDCTGTCCQKNKKIKQKIKKDELALIKIFLCSKRYDQESAETNTILAVRDSHTEYLKRGATQLLKSNPMKKMIFLFLFFSQIIS